MIKETWKGAWLLLLAMLSLTACQNLHLGREPGPRTQPLPLKVETERFQRVGKSPVIGRIYRFRLHEGDTLADVARHFGIGLQAMMDANPDIDPWSPGKGRKIVLPLAFILPLAPKEGIVINLPAMRLFHFPRQGGTYIQSYPVGIGRSRWETPLGRTKIVQKKVHPSWVVPASIRREHARKGDPLPKVVPPGPDNPLGSHALRLGFPGYLIHGTSKPYGVGLRISHGCIRLYPENIKSLFPQVRVGTPATIVDQPYLIGWRDKQLYLEAHTPLQEKSQALKNLVDKLHKRLRREEKKTGRSIDWKRVTEIIAEARGIPVPVLTSAPPLSALIDQAPVIPHPGVWPQQYQPPSFANGWYVALELYLSPINARKLVAMLRHQGPPLPAHRIEDRVVIGPYQSKKEADKVKARLQRELGLKGNLWSPDKSRQWVDRVADHSS